MTADTLFMATDPKKPKITGMHAIKESRKATQLPKPSGYRILCAVPEIEEKYDNGILKADVTIRNDELLTTILFVVALGPDCYKNPDTFPTGPWCKEGDFILVRPHIGTRVVIHDKEYRLINDDCVEAVVEDPRGYRRK
jgi:co-chaperonin GroES (HSP10)